MPKVKLVALSREDHTDIDRPKIVREKLNSEIKLLPLRVVFLGRELYCVKNGSDFQDAELEGKIIESINGETPISIVDKIGNLFASDGFIKTVKYSDLEGFNFSTYYFYYYGQVNQFDIKFKDINEPVIIKPLNIKAINQHLNSRYEKKKNTEEKALLEYKILNDSVAYLGIHTFDNDDIKKYTKEKKLNVFLKHSFKSIKENKIKTLVVDVSKNSGGSEGNEGLVLFLLRRKLSEIPKGKSKNSKSDPRQWNR
jgi:hypothetical protein